MSGFSGHWLDLREPLDHEARDADLLGMAIARLPDPGGRILDLGCGTGSTLRAFAATGCTRARWRLVDRDAALLALARRRCGAEVETVVGDLGELAPITFAATDLVTASALLDLCSEDWLTRLAERLAALRLPFYAALTFDGAVTWAPEHGLDREIVAAFNDHQRREKGFGRALGPEAGEAVVRIFRSLGFRVAHAPSPWHIRASDAALHAMFVDGMAEAVRETGAIPAQEIEDWRRLRRDLPAGGRCMVGHLDMLALPPAQSLPEAGQARAKLQSKSTSEPMS